MKDLDWYKDEIHCLYDEKKELQQRIDKAIEYINYMFDKGNDEDIVDDLLELEKILKGSDSNVKD